MQSLIEIEGPRCTRGRKSVTGGLEKARNWPQMVLFRTVSMPHKLIVLADLGRLKAFRVTRDEMTSKLHVELAEELNLLDGQEKLLEKVTDKAGRFPASGGSNGAGALSAGENHNLQSEIQKRLIKRIGEGINELVKRDNPTMWHFAAAQEINARIQELLCSEVRAKLSKSVGSDLTKIGKNELLSHFTS